MREAEPIHSIGYAITIPKDRGRRRQAKRDSNLSRSKKCLVTAPEDSNVPIDVVGMESQHQKCLAIQPVV